jgi:SAM-dependent methyltransferase
MILPAVPSLLDHYESSLAQMFAGLGRAFNEAERAELRRLLDSKLREGFQMSPYTRVLVEYGTEPPPGTALHYTLLLAKSTIADEYAGWVQTRTPPYFGIHPDAKIVAAAEALGAPGDVTVLDIGAGTGRNTLPLARRGFKTDAVEIAPALAAILRSDAEKDGLDVRIFEGDVLSPALTLPEGHYRLVCLAEVIASHFRTQDELARLFTRVSRLLASGGELVFNAFVPKEGYRPDALARELSQVFWCNLFTRGELGAAMQGLPFELVSEESAHDFEAAHQPADGWPPTGWFVDWARGNDLFDVERGRAPIELYWFVYRRRGQ